MRPELEIKRLRSAVDEAVAATPILRTRIGDLPGVGLIQSILDQPAIWATNTTCTSLSEYEEADKQEVMGLNTALMRVGCAAGNGKYSKKRFFVWTLNHALYDGLSTPISFQKLVDAYHKRAPASRISPPFQLFVKHILDTDELQTSQYWERQFVGVELQPFPKLPYKNYQPTPESLATHVFKDLVWPHGDATASTLLRTAWTLISTRHINTANAVSGATVTGRQAPVPEIDLMTGPTLATVPHRNRRINSDAEGICGFQTLLIVQTAGLSEDNTEDTLFVLSEDDDGIGCAFADFSRYALTIECRLNNCGVDFYVAFDSQVISGDQLSMLCTQYEHVLRQLCDPGQAQTKHADLSMTSADDLGKIWSWTKSVPQTVHEPVHEIVTTAAKKYADATAVCAWDGEWSYKELDDLSEHVAHYLVSISCCGRDTIVPLLFPKSRWTPIAMLAAMKAGAASVLFDTNLPEDRLRLIVGQVQPSFLITSRSTEELSGRLSVQEVIVLDETFLSYIAVPSPRALLPKVESSDILYVVFTSGTTGTPKGVVITHSNLASALLHQANIHNFVSGARVFDFAGYAFDVAWASALFAFACGACLCIPSEEERKNDLAGSIQRFGVTLAELTPSVAQTLPIEVLQSLDTLILGGERLPAEQARVWAAVVDVKNSYGPCECTPTTVVANIHAGKVTDACIGKGSGVNTWVVDPASTEHLLPIGAIGELLLEGSLVGPGYLSAPEKTAAAFVEDPLWLTIGSTEGRFGRRGRLYKTGDLVRYETNGDLVYVGRKDIQVKINGQRVELADIEHHVAAAISFNGQARVVADVVQPKDGNRAILVAFLHLSDHNAASPESLSGAAREILAGVKDRLSSQVPLYMIPSAYLPVDTLPLSTSNKIDRRKLKAIAEKLTLQELTELHAPTEAREPTLPLERRLLHLWSTVLGVPNETIGVDSSFFQLGGDSISAMRLVSAARDQDLPITVSNIFEHPCLSELAAVAISHDGTRNDPKHFEPFELLQQVPDLSEIVDKIAQLCNVRSTIVEDVFPCTPLQEGLLAMTARRAGQYLGRFAMRIKPNINQEAFVIAWEAVVAANPILRTRIVDIPKHALFQVILNETAHWTTDDSLRSVNEYESLDEKHLMGLGTPLVRVGLVDEPGPDGGRFFV